MRTLSRSAVSRRTRDRIEGSFELRAVMMEEGVEKYWGGRRGSRRWEKRVVEWEEGIVLSFIAWRIRMGARTVCESLSAGFLVDIARV